MVLQHHHADAVPAASNGVSLVLVLPQVTAAFVSSVVVQTSLDQTSLAS